MSELRKDPVIGRWTIFAPERARRPTSLRADTMEFLDHLAEGVCAFCPGSEAKTPPEILAIRADGTAPNTPGWDVRVVPNQYPAMRVEGELDKVGEGMYDTMRGIGAHEVFIETPEHDNGVEHRRPTDLAKLFGAYRSRLIDLSRDTRFKYILIFKNSGTLAGASQAHPHSQLIATPVTPILVRDELNGARDYFNYRDRCVFCDIIRQELRDRTRIIAETAHFVAGSPYAARFPFETRIYPKRHCADFQAATDAELLGLAEIVIDVMQRLVRGLGRPNYNWVLHTAPVRWKRTGYWQTLDQDFHWYLEILPKISVVAGFEWGSGFYINPTLPEEAAAFLRDVNLG